MPTAFPPLIEFRNVSKKFGDLYANREICLDIGEGEIHAIAGENGAGKTTLMNLLFGRIRPDSGSILLRGNPVFFRSPGDAIRAGIGMVHQNILFFPQLSVLENIIVGNESESGKAGKSTLRAVLLGTGRAREKLLGLQDLFGFRLDPDRAANELPFAQRQQIELLRILYRAAKVLILDEPTSLLSPRETQKLLELIASLRHGGCTIIFISHRLSEIFSIADRITVLRLGSVADTLETGNTDTEEVARLMIGGTEDHGQGESKLQSRSPLSLFSKSPLPPFIKGGCPDSRPPSTAFRPPSSDLCLEIRNLGIDPCGAEPAVENVSISIEQGEIFGIGGIVGNGQRALALALAGKVRPVAGEILFGGSDISGKEISGMEISGMGVKERLRKGIHWLPENPAEESLMPERPLWENFVLGRQREAVFEVGGILKKDAVLQFAMDQIRENSIAAPDVFEPLASLSGGNRQKVALARVLTGSPRLVILEQPTRGLDLHASGRLYQRLFELSRQEGMTFIILSYDLDELICLCDRIAILYRGKITGMAERGAFSRELLGQWMTGGVRANTAL